MLELLSNPHSAYPSAHVAGTKGKGSTSAFIASILRAHGRKTGLYVSPHVLDLRERISVNGEWVSEEEFARLTARLKPVVEKVEKEMIPTTYFEILTALGMMYFAQEKVDCAVFEVGIGGRLDATNVVTPVVSVITTIGFDHMDKLGNTLSAIAGEKCGIVKPGVLVVSAPQLPEPMETIERICGERGSPLRVVGRDIRIADSPAGLCYETEKGRYEVAKLGIEGIHQRENAACAIAAAEEFDGANMIRLDKAAVAEGLASTHLRARFEVIEGKPVQLLDGAHNRESLRALVDSLKLRDDLRGRRTVVVVGLAADKDLKGCLSILDEVADEFILTRTTNPRAAEPRKLLEVLSEVSTKKSRVVEQIPEAYRAGREAAGPDGLVIITGSFYLAGEVASAIIRTGGQA
jgi:dihydrofolate synthase/folylpolyglutamate synthase